MQSHVSQLEFNDTLMPYLPLMDNEAEAGRLKLKGERAESISTADPKQTHINTRFTS